MPNHTPADATELRVPCDASQSEARLAYESRPESVSSDLLLGFGGLGRAARDRSASAIEALDMLADDLGLRVVVRNDGGFGIQFSIPEQMRVSSEKGAGQLLVDTDPMLSPTSSSTGQHRTVPILVTFDPTGGASLVVGAPSNA